MDKACSIDVGDEQSIEIFRGMSRRRGQFGDAHVHDRINISDHRSKNSFACP
jgi:hypothetical protein